MYSNQIKSIKKGLFSKFDIKIVSKAIFDFLILRFN